MSSQPNLYPVKLYNSAARHHTDVCRLDLGLAQLCLYLKACARQELGTTDR